jgi:hypothetical protein
VLARIAVAGGHESDRWAQAARAMRLSACSMRCCVLRETAKRISGRPAGRWCKSECVNSGRS